MLLSAVWRPHIRCSTPSSLHHHQHTALGIVTAAAEPLRTVRGPFYISITTAARSRQRQQQRKQLQVLNSTWPQQPLRRTTRLAASLLPADTAPADKAPAPAAEDQASSKRGRRSTTTSAAAGIDLKKQRQHSAVTQQAHVVPSNTAGKRTAQHATAAIKGAAAGAATKHTSSSNSGTGQHRQRTPTGSATIQIGPTRLMPQPLPRVLILHTGGTLGMDVQESFELSDADNTQLTPLQLKKGTGGTYKGLQPGDMLSNLFQMVPELTTFANLDLQVVFNKDSSRVGPKEWGQLAKVLHKNRAVYDAFLIVHGTDTMAYTASALSLMLAGFKKPIVLTGSQVPLSSPRTDARQNLIDALTCATCGHRPPHAEFTEVAICFGGKLMRGNRAQKVNSSSYQAFDSPSYPLLAELGIDVAWNKRHLLKVEGGYTPRFKLDPAVIRIPIVPGSDPRLCYGDLAARGVKGVVLEAFGVGNMPDQPSQGWLPWLKQQTQQGLQVYLASQCHLGELHPELYRAGAMAMQMGVEAGPQMTPECAVVKMMLCLCHPDIPLGLPLAGEL